MRNAQERVVNQERARYQMMRKELGRRMTREEELLTLRHEEEMAALLVERCVFNLGILFS